MVHINDFCHMLSDRQHIIRISIVRAGRPIVERHVVVAKAAAWHSARARRTHAKSKYRTICIITKFTLNITLERDAITISLRLRRHCESA